MSRIVVTGIGVISPIGNTVEENRLSLINGYCGIKPTDPSFPSRFAGKLPFGQVGISTEELLALHAFKEAIADSGLTAEKVSDFSTALIGATTVGGMCLTDQLHSDANNNGEGSEYLSSYDCASINIYLHSRYKMKGINNTINTACSSSANAIMYGARLIKNGIVKRAVVGGVDSISKFTINGFNALYILSPEICTPFDKDRKGLNLGEAGAFLVLEKEEDTAGKKVYAALTGYCNANDAYHPSSLSESGDGPYLSMKGALDQAGLLPDHIDFINAHGTATDNNDQVESNAILRLFTAPPPFASTKSNTGHTLGASGALEAVYSVLNLSNQEMYPSLNFTNPIDTTGLIPVLTYTKTTLNQVMSNSFGFGGNCTSLIFTKA